MIDIKQEEIDAFNVKLVELLKEFSFTLGSEALIQDGKIVSKVVVIPKKVAPAAPKAVDAVNNEENEEKGK